MDEASEHAVTVDDERDSDGLVRWHCKCGVWGTDYDEREADESIALHLDGNDTTR
jgi:hypothetical protein